MLAGSNMSPCPSCWCYQRQNLPEVVITLITDAPNLLDQTYNHFSVGPLAPPHLLATCLSTQPLLAVLAAGCDQQGGFHHKKNNAFSPPFVIKKKVNIISLQIINILSK